MDDLIDEFLAETQESLAELDADIVALEQNPNDNDLISKIFRLVHTIKGTCGFLGLSRLEKVAHHGENVLGRFRDGDLQVTPEYVTLILESFDCIKLIVNGIEETGSEPEGDDSALIAKLDAVYESDGNAPATLDAPAQEAEQDTDSETDVDIQDIENKDAKDITTDDLDALFDADNAKRRADETEDAAPEAADAPEAAAEQPAPPTPPVAQNAAPEKSADKPVQAKEIAKDKPTSNASLRVNVQVLENLMTTVSELVLTRNQLLQILRSQTDSEFAAPLQRLNQVVSELQEGVMQTRMQPIGNAWGKLPRIVRDISVELNKKINLEMRGQETELDRQVLDLIKDPLTHMVRNSGDHGIETPEERLAAGKQEEGTILLNAFHEGGHIIIEISDDGKGLNLERIKQKVAANGLASEEELAEMSDQKIQQYIFHAGLSTAEKVTSVSGRGVGMDVVRTNIEKIGGTIDLKSIEGKGSTFTIKIPLTLAIVSALIVEVQGQRYAMPQISVQELVRTSSNSENCIEDIQGTPVLRLRDRLLPLVNLEDMLQHDNALAVQIDTQDTADHEDAIDEQDEGASDPQSEGENNTDSDVEHESESNVVHLNQDDASDESYIIVAHVGSYSFGIIVDRVFDTEEIVVKPVSPILRHIEIFAGNTILGDGSVIMILDPNGIANMSGEISVSDQGDEIGTAGEHAADVAGQKTSLLVFKAGDGAPKAVPLSLVSRLEEVEVKAIEYSAGSMVVQYRGSLMPLIPFDDTVQLRSEGHQPVLVFADHQRTMGLVVDEIIDIVEERMDVQLMTGNNGLLGSSIIKDTAMDVIDVGHYLGRSNEDWFSNEGQAASNKASLSGQRVLLVDDSPFFRNMLEPMLKIAGYEVVTVEDASMAIELWEKESIFDIIISDIEMPDMNGFEFAQKVKAQGSIWQDVPMIALSAHTSPQDMDLGRQSGFNDYVAKFDRDALLESISQTLSSKHEEVA